MRSAGLVAAAASAPARERKYSPKFFFRGRLREAFRQVEELK